MEGICSDLCQNSHMDSWTQGATGRSGLVATHPQGVLQGFLGPISCKIILDSQKCVYLLNNNFTFSLNNTLGIARRYVDSTVLVKKMCLPPGFWRKASVIS